MTTKNSANQYLDASEKSISLLVKLYTFSDKYMFDGKIPEQSEIEQLKENLVYTEYEQEVCIFISMLNCFLQTNVVDIKIPIPLASSSIYYLVSWIDSLKGDSDTIWFFDEVLQINWDNAQLLEIIEQALLNVEQLFAEVPRVA